MAVGRATCCPPPKSRSIPRKNCVNYWPQMVGKQACQAYALCWRQQQVQQNKLIVSGMRAITSTHQLN